jgi:hypothetical protein
MKPIVNSDGDYKCIDANGNVKWLAPIIATNEFRMKSVGISVCYAPKSLEPTFVEEPDAEENETNQNDIVAESAPAKRGRKTKL